MLMKPTFLRQGPTVGSSLFGLLLLFVVAPFGTGCAKASRPHDEGLAPSSAPASPGAVPQVRARAIIVDTSLTVGDVDASGRTLRDALERSGGYVADANMSGLGDDRSAVLDLRVPAQALKPFLATLAGTGETASYTERAEDVTEQITDLKARLGNARAQEKRILELMSAKTATLAETIEAEKELSRIRESIERLDAQDRNVETRVSYATVRVSLTGHSVDAWRSPGSSIARAAATGVRGAAAFFVYVGMALAMVLPTLLPIGLLVFGVVFAIRARGSKRRTALAE
jgi:hypothetical protein